MVALLHDLHYGLRALAKNRGFTLIAILSLAIGIGANTTVFTLVNAIWIRQIPVAEPARLVSVHTVDPRNPGLLLCSYPNFKDLRDQNQVFSSLLAYSVITMSLTGRTDPQFLMGHLVSGNYFSTLGVNPGLGRGFLPEEDAATGSAPVVVLSHALWMRQFNGDPQVTAKTISLSGRVFNIVGVAPKGFQGLNQLYAADVWVPMGMAPIMYPYPVMLTRRGALMISVAGRLRPDVGQAQAESAMQTLAVELERQYPRENEGRRYKLVSLAEASLPATTRTAMSNAGLLLFIISALVLLISCGNLASLLLARGASRSKEIHIRLALGASRWQIIRQLLVESVLLGVLGGIAGLVVAKVARDAVWALRPPSFSYSGIELALDRKVLAYTLITSFVTGILSGLVPALRATRGDLATELKQRTGRTGSGGQWQLRSLLVSGQVAFSVVALVGASLFVRSMQNALRIDPGYPVAQLGFVAFNVADQAYNESRGREFQNRALQVAGSTPGVVSAALRRDLPFRVTSARTVLLEGQDTEQGRITLTTAVSPGYFQTMGITLVRGRDFTVSDSLAAPRTAVVNEAGAAHFWPGQDPIGRRFRLLADPVPLEVVGIARNANYQTLGEQPQVMLYFSLMQFYSPAAVLYVRTTGDPEVMSATVRKEMQALDRNLLLQSESVGKTIRESLWAQRLSGGLLAIFGVLALVLSTMGIYGVIGYSINQRTREFGVRLALGATTLQVQKMVLTEGVRLVTIGTVAGLVISVGASQAVRSMLFVVSPYDALTFVMVPAILTLVGALASWIPAMRTVHIDPAIALRDE